ncbi:hypothetical protein Ga0102493_111550 [Erythrobacter litoralis]|nr:hypothetical protein [Erythrobacter litoralis]AOL22577.1 hypothetical protein Ga0102493_111550 [Erythrobacter litoralis]MEE4337650.1 hypothetical protein [Erythrobacter sp.]
MQGRPERPLTERQQAVMERIDRRVPIKVIAQELGVSETRVNQHIRALKDIYSAENLGDLVERYRASLPETGEGDSNPAGEDAGAKRGAETGAPFADAVNLKGFSEASYRKSQMAGPAQDADEPDRVDHGELVMSDVMPLMEQAPWLKPKEPQVVPGLLDGENAVLFRLAAIVGIAFGCLAAVVLTVTAAVTITEALDGRASIPVDEQGLS